MAAKNIKTRTLSNEIQTAIDDALYHQHHMVKEFENDLNSKRVNLEYVKEHSRHDDFTAKLARQTRRAETNLKEHQRKYDEILADRLSMKGDNATEALLAETRATKTWARIERNLAGKDKAQQLQIIEDHISSAVKRGDHTTVAAINSEAPDYLSTNGVEDPGHLIELIVRTHDPELRQALDTVTEATKLVAVVRHNTGVAQRAFEENLSTGIKTRIDDTERVPYFVDAGEAVRNQITEANEALKAALARESKPDEDDVSVQDTSGADSSDSAAEHSESIQVTEPGEQSRFNPNEAYQPATTTGDND